MGSPCPSPRASCVEAGPHRALFTTPKTHKDQSEHKGGSTSERKKGPKQLGRKEEELQDGEEKKGHVPSFPKPALEKLEKRLLSSKATSCPERSPTTSEPETGRVPASGTP